ncbi:Cyanovirin-N [Aspergillus pseudonomiae]|uniref:Cyanovirin-N n=1 Tax=Aspergillus pseudonomiae TaxID=1506151 RepID=A0A5N6IAZ5_9EURO|nr:Cyanovirin-N [Aspergillus pseudonomiae]KAB8263424.1 Cyanovirin-N [Aspergillus pseudonomiae]KAE8409961.1 Cyanovirin-N [Aspergillus pseudonomiae]
MSFHETACDIHLDHERGKRRTSLVAICNNEEGSGLTSDILLDDFLGNDNGHFVWGGKNVTKTSRNLSITREGPSRVPILHADLLTDSGEYVSAHCPLDEHIFNINGELLFKPDEARE